MSCWARLAPVLVVKECDGHHFQHLGFFGALLLDEVVFDDLGFQHLGFATVLLFVVDTDCLFLGGVFGILVYYGRTFPWDAQMCRLGCTIACAYWLSEAGAM